MKLLVNELNSAVSLKKGNKYLIPLNGEYSIAQYVGQYYDKFWFLSNGFTHGYKKLENIHQIQPKKKPLMQRISQFINDYKSNVLIVLLLIILQSPLKAQATSASVGSVQYTTVLAQLMRVPNIQQNDLNSSTSGTLVQFDAPTYNDIAGASVSATNITLPNGRYKITSTIYFETNSVQRANVATEILINGTSTGFTGAMGYIRRASGHNESSTTVSDIVVILSLIHI